MLSQMGCKWIFVLCSCGIPAYCDSCRLHHGCCITSMSCAQNFVRTNSWESYTSNAGTSLHLYDGHFCTGEILERGLPEALDTQDVMAFAVCPAMKKGRHHLQHALACSICVKSNCWRP